MIQNTNISFLGGDLRNVKLAQMMKKDGFNVKTYALEKSLELQNIEKCKNIKELVKNSQIIVGPIPFLSGEKNINTPFSDEKIEIKNVFENICKKKLIAGNIKPEIYEMAKKYEIEIIDILKQEELVIMNTIATAEGAIEIAIKETQKTIYKSNILILGFGRVAKTLANTLKNFGANLYCAARKKTDLAWIKTYGYNEIEFEKFGEQLQKFDIIFNTIPEMILDKEKLRNIQNDAVIIDLASSPGGVDQNEAKILGIKDILALGLPGKVAPITSAKFIKESIYNVMNFLEGIKEKQEER